MLATLHLILSSCCEYSLCGEKYVYSGACTKKIDAPELCHTLQHRLPYIRHELHLRLEDASVYYGEYVNTIRLQFISMDILEIREARFLITDLVEGVLAELNTNPIIAAEYITYPMTPRQLEIIINFESYEGMYIDPYYVGCIKMVDEMVTYDAFNTKYDGLNKWQYREEPYDKAREFTIAEREAEKLLQDAVDAEIPKRILKDQYFNPVKEVPRYFSPYPHHFIFDR
jgi:hypothetical protein